MQYMLENYLDLKASEQKEILQTAASKLGKQESVLEKDIWVCWVLQALFSMENYHPMAFKGGTSLSKVFGIIDRFSEDVDITLDYQSFEDTEYSEHPNIFKPFADDTSKNQVKKFGERLKKYVKTYTENVVVPHLKSELTKLPTAKQHKIEIDESGEKIWISYPSVAEDSDDYLKSHILIEFGGRNVISPNEIHNIVPYVAECTTNVLYPTCNVNVLSPGRTFWEKATLVHVECNRGEIRKNVERLSRHWYDLAMLSKHDLGKAAINDRELFEDVVSHKKVFFNSSSANYDECLSGKLELLPGAETINGLESDYKEMVKAGMIYIDPPKFSEIVEIIGQLEIEINKW